MTDLHRGHKLPSHYNGGDKEILTSILNQINALNEKVESLEVSSINGVTCFEALDSRVKLLERKTESCRSSLPCQRSDAHHDVEPTHSVTLRVVKPNSRGE